MMNNSKEFMFPSPNQGENMNNSKESMFSGPEPPSSRIQNPKKPNPTSPKPATKKQKNTRRPKKGLAGV